MSGRLEQAEKQLGEMKGILATLPGQLDALNGQFGRFRRFIMRP